MHRKVLQSVLHRGLKLAADAPDRFPPRFLRTGLGVRLLDVTLRRLARADRNTNNSLIANYDVR